MGRHRWTNRLTTEQCPLNLRIDTFTSANEFDLAVSTAASYSHVWKLQNGKVEARVAYRIQHIEAFGVAIVIPAQSLGISIGGSDPFEVTVASQVIRVTTTRARRGVRHWFQCACGQRVGRLYQPFREQRFRCRRCHNLTYETAQRHDHRLYRLALNIVAIKALLNAPSLKLQLRGVAALALHMKWLKQGRLEPVHPNSILKENPTEDDQLCRLVPRSRNILFSISLASDRRDAKLKQEDFAPRYVPRCRRKSVKPA